MTTDDDETRGMPTESEVLESVRKSGYLMDQEVATLVEDLGFNVQTSWPFEDPDEGESRELDVWAIRQISDNAQPQLFVELFCECKGGEDRPLVFLTRRKGLIDQNVCPAHYVFPLHEYEEKTPTGSKDVKAFAHLDLAKHHYWYIAGTKAVQFAKIIRKKQDWEAQHDGLYNSLLVPLAKALAYRAKIIRNRQHPFNLCFPIVVLKSPLYVVDSAKRPLHAERVSHVSFFRRLESSTVKGEYIVDFVTLDGLRGFVQDKVMPFVVHVEAIARSNPNRLLVRRPVVLKP